METPGSRAALPPAGDPAVGVPGARPSRWGVVAGVGTFALLVADLPELSSGVWAPKYAVLMVVGALGLPALVARAWGYGTVPAGRSGVWAARLALAFVAWATVATIASAAPWFAAVGPYDQGTGLIFWAAAAGCFGLGTTLGPADRRWVEGAFLTGALVNAGIAILQVWHDLTPVGILSYNGLPTGLFGNPAFLGPVLAAAMVLAWRRMAEDPLRWGIGVGVLGVALGVCTERLPALSVVVAAVWLLMSSWRAPAQGSRRRAATFVVVVVGSLAVGSAVGRRQLGAGNGVVSHFAASNTNETFGQRLDIWRAGLVAVAHHPWFGAGPGGTQAATQPLLSLAEARSLGSSVFLDAHDLLVEVAVTVGVIGLVLLLCWLATALVGRRGTMVVAAVVLLVSELAEPLNVVLVPMALLLIAGAPRRAGGAGEPATAGDAATADVGPGRARGLPRWVRAATVVVGALSLVPALALAVGDIEIDRGYTQLSLAENPAALTSARTAERLLFPWPDPATLLAKVYYDDSLDFEPGAKAATIRWSQVAADRDPGNSGLWVLLANYQLENLDLAGARASAAHAVTDAPDAAGADDMEGDVLYLSHHVAAADGWWRRSLAIMSSQPGVVDELHGRCEPVLSRSVSVSVNCLNARDGH